jgi:mRNA-degrading endonuclease YafQ of YafQ-DinJ toxin-antitoxin module
LALTPVEVKKSFKKRLHKKPAAMQKVIEDAVTQLRKDPHHTGLHTHRIWGSPGVWAARLDKGNRLTFHWEGDQIVLRNHCNHDILKKP